jgi:uncharacterized protein (DUF488 family)
MIYSIGHSVHPIDVFLDLLAPFEIRRLADVRSIPASRRHPQFCRAPLAAALLERGVEYVHMPALGGRRTPRADSINGGLRNPSYRGYADHMQSDEFARALEQLIGSSRQSATVIMCAELRYADCHRQLLADALLVRSVLVLHIVPGTPPKRHCLSEFARPEARKVSYPGLV